MTSIPFFSFLLLPPTSSVAHPPPTVMITAAVAVATPHSSSSPHLPRPSPTALLPTPLLLPALVRLGRCHPLGLVFAHLLRIAAISDAVVASMAAANPDLRTLSTFPSLCDSSRLWDRRGGSPPANQLAAFLALISPRHFVCTHVHYMI